MGPSGANQYNAFARETGLIEELLLTTGVGTPLSDVLLGEFVRREPHLALFLNTSVRGVEMAGARIARVRASQLGSEREFLFTVRQVVDCTGDGTVGLLAGADWRMGREARGEYGEPMAPVEADAWTMGSTVLLRARNAGRPVPFTAPDWAHRYETEEAVGVCRWLGAAGGEGAGGWWWMEIGMPPWDTVRDNEAITRELHRRALGVWDFFKNRFREAASYAPYELEWIGAVPGKRESRRLLGDVVLSEYDCHIDRHWPDAVAYGGWYLDLHTSGGVLNPAEPAEYAHLDGAYANWARVAPYGIPLRALYSRTIENLWMAGRNLSATHVALGSARVMLTTACLGQAAGAAAAHALAHDLLPRQAAAAPHIGEIQRRLLRDDARLLGFTREEDDDLARTARVTASSSAPLILDRLTGARHALDPARGLVLPLSGPRLDTLAVCLSAEADCAVAIELRRLRRLWDQDAGEALYQGALAAPAGEARWVACAPNLAITPGLYRLALHPAPGVQWHE
ncbi:MAG TPA: FAD-dependent oxidoreductase, partial [Armatimonadota bacterium]|nr:FAD-dependent oxidoreductase [Armatimonadota bacterium]